jgi:glyoxylase-like metal-dependent hydrolase (beta-lactamase superfamily II)
MALRWLASFDLASFDPSVGALALALACATSGCAAPRTIPEAAAVTLAHADRYAHADARVGTYVSSNWGFSTNSFWIEGPSGLVVIDTQFLPSAAAEMVDWAEGVTGKKVVLAIVLHPNPDKFNGTSTLQRRGIRVVTSDQVRALIPAVFEARTRAFRSRYAPDWPSEVPMPDSFGARTADLDAAGLTLRMHVLGAATSDAHVVVEWQGHVFTGDLVASQCHAWLELGHVDEWLTRLSEVKALHPTFVHPGRGPSAGPELLDAQAEYLAQVKDLMLQEHPTGAVRPDAIEHVKAALVARYPAYDFDVFLGMGLPAVWTRYAQGAH